MAQTSVLRSPGLWLQPQLFVAEYIHILYHYKFKKYFKPTLVPKKNLHSQKFLSAPHKQSTKPIGANKYTHLSILPTIIVMPLPISIDNDKNLVKYIISVLAVQYYLPYELWHFRFDKLEPFKAEL